MQNKLKFFAGLLLAVLLVACSNRPDNVLSRSEMTDFLVDLHRLDGSLMAKGMGNADDRENIYYYNALLKKHRITKADFDSSLVWYSKNPKKFDRVYIDVVAQLTELDKKVAAGYFHPEDSMLLRKSKTDIWPLPERKYCFSKDSATSRIHFVVRYTNLLWKDKYSLSFLYRFGKQNTYKNQRAYIRIHYADKTSDSIVFKTISDSLLRRYTVTFYARKKCRIDSLSGEILGYSAKKASLVGCVDSIQLLRYYDALAQDSILKVLDELNKATTAPVKGKKSAISKSIKDANRKVVPRESDLR